MTGERRKGYNLIAGSPKDKEPWKIDWRRNLRFFAKRAQEKPGVKVDDKEILAKLSNSTAPPYDIRAAEEGWGTIIEYVCGCQMKIDAKGTEYLIVNCDEHPDGPSPDEFTSEETTGKVRGTAKGKEPQNIDQGVENTLYFRGSYESSNRCGRCSEPLYGIVNSARRSRKGFYKITFVERCAAHGINYEWTQEFAASKVVISAT